MGSKTPLLEEMLSLVEELVENSKKLVQKSDDPIAEDEIMVLEKRGEELLSEIIEKDKLIAHKKYPHSKDAVDLHRAIQKKLHEFQKLNDTFFSRLANHLTIIQFAPRQAMDNVVQNQTPLE